MRRERKQGSSPEAGCPGPSSKYVTHLAVFHSRVFITIDIMPTVYDACDVELYFGGDSDSLPCGKDHMTKQRDAVRGRVSDPLLN